MKALGMQQTVAISHLLFTCTCVTEAHRGVESETGVVRNVTAGLGAAAERQEYFER